MPLDSLDLNTLLQTAVIAGPIVSLVTIFARKLTAKYGMEVSKLVLQASIFVIGVLVALALKFAPEDLLVVAGSIFLSAIAFYDVVIKAVLKPIYEKNYGGTPNGTLEDEAPEILPEKSKK